MLTIHSSCLQMISYLINCSFKYFNNTILRSLELCLNGAAHDLQLTFLDSQVQVLKLYGNQGATNRTGPRWTTDQPPPPH